MRTVRTPHARVRWLVAALLLPAVAAARRVGDVPAPATFVRHVIDTGLTGGYQVVVADFNHDGKPDLLAVASGRTDLAWYENPSWTRHVIATGITDPINAAVADVDGDGIPEVALAHGFSNVVAESPGVLSILTHGAAPGDPWTMREIDRIPTSHRLRFVDAAGDGRPVLVNLPLIGARALAPDYRDQVPFTMYRPGAWRREVVSEAERGVVHGVTTVRWTPGRESVLSAGFLGVSRFDWTGRAWTRTPVIVADTTRWPKSGASEVAVARLGAERALATVEPWHGNEVVAYRPAGSGWRRVVLDSTLTDAHTLVSGDLDGTGSDVLVAGERRGRRSVYLYRLADAARDRWSRTVLDDGGMAAAGCAVADLNADGRVDVTCIGTATANLAWYENRR